MAEYLTNTADLTAVADAIRAKGGISAQLIYPSGCENTGMAPVPSVGAELSRKRYL